MKKIIVTGSAGFVGSHFVEHILKNTDWIVVGIDSFRHRGDALRCHHLVGERYRVIAHDLTTPISMREIAKIGKVDYIVNFASLSHVDLSIEDPVNFGENNVKLILNVLDYARRAQPEKFIQISTDEVFGPAIAPYCHREWDPILPSNPYSASKAAQEAFAFAFWRTYGLPIIITNTMNIFGERQDPEKFVPKCIANILAGKEIVIHGKPEAIGSRFYLHARNQADAVLYLLKHVTPTQYDGKSNDRQVPSRFNIVGDIEVNNLDLAQMIARTLQKDLIYRFEDFHSTRPGHDLRYALDGQKMRDAGWKAPVPFEASLEKTVRWTLENPEWML